VNIKTLAKLYDRLTPWERLPLITAAVERGDDAETHRLSRSAPRLHLRLPDYHGLSDGLMLLTFFHVIGQLERGLLYWHAAGAAAEAEEFPVGPDDKGFAERLWGVARLTAYRLNVEADGWTRFCAALHLDGEALLRNLPCYDTLQRTQQTARLVACTAAEAADYLRRLGWGDAAPPTVEGVAKGLREFLEARFAWWNGDG
jgi:hypothetical protein